MKLLEPITVGKLVIKNRLMFPPLTTGYEGRDGSITPRSKAFYARLAQGGAGYIVVGDVNPVASFSPTPRLYDDTQIDSFRELADAVHEYGAKLGVQIFYPEYDVEAIMALAAGGNMPAVREKLEYDMKRFTDEVSEEKLLEILEKMKNCAVRAQKAGVDAVQIHGDRLLGALCGTSMNHRNDEYGASLENRTRFARMVTRAIRAAVPDMTLEYKLSIATPERGKGGIDLKDAAQFARWLQEDGVDALHVAQANHTGNLADTIPPMGVQRYGFFVEHARMIRKAVSIPVSCAGRITDIRMAEQILQSGSADMVAAGRALLCDPDWIVKAAGGKVETIRRCVSCNKGCVDAIQSRSAISCVLNAQNGFELERAIIPSHNPKRVAVVGGGPAGLEAARVCALRGHRVTLWEKDTSLGGQIRLASVPPRKHEMRRAIIDLTRAVEDAGVELRMGREVSAREILSENPAAVIVAVGANNAIPPIPGRDMAHVFDAWSVLAGDRDAGGDIIVIGGGLVGCEVAEFLACQGNNVTIVEMLDQIASGESATVLPTLLDSFDAHGVKRHTGATVKRIEADRVICSDKDGNELSLRRDFVVMATGARAAAFDTSEFEAAGIPVTRVGDCAGRAGDIGSAVRAAFDAACAV